MALKNEQDTRFSCNNSSYDEQSFGQRNEVAASLSNTQLLLEECLNFLNKCREQHYNRNRSMDNPVKKEPIFYLEEAATETFISNIDDEVEDDIYYDALTTAPDFEDMNAPIDPSLIKQEIIDSQNHDYNFFPEIKKTNAACNEQKHFLKCCTVLIKRCDDVIITKKRKSLLWRDPLPKKICKPENELEDILNEINTVYEAPPKTFEAALNFGNLVMQDPRFLPTRKFIKNRKRLNWSLEEDQIIIDSVSTYLKDGYNLTGLSAYKNILNKSDLLKENKRLPRQIKKRTIQLSHKNNTIILEKLCGINNATTEKDKENIKRFTNIIRASCLPLADVKKNNLQVFCNTTMK